MTRTPCPTGSERNGEQDNRDAADGCTAFLLHRSATKSRQLISESYSHNIVLSPLLKRNRNQLDSLQPTLLTSAGKDCRRRETATLVSRTFTVQAERCQRLLPRAPKFGYSCNCLENLRRQGLLPDWLPECCRKNCKVGQFDASRELCRSPPQQ